MPLEKSEDLFLNSLKVTIKLILDGTGPNLWPELKPMIWKMLGSSSIQMIESAFLIMEELFTYATSIFLESQNELNMAFTAALCHGDNNLKIASIKAFAALIVVLEPKQCRHFDDLLPKALEGLKQLLNSDQDLGDEALSMFTDISEAEPKFFKKHFQETFDTMYIISINKNIEESGIKKMATELIVSIVERLPSLIRKNPDNLRKLFEMIFSQMILIEDEIEEEWMKPKEGYNEDFEEDSDLEVVRFGMNAVDRLISAIGEKDALPVLSQLVQSLLQNEDWRYKNAAILALSQVGEYISSVTEVKPIIDVVLGFLNNNNAKLRYACCHCLGQIADDMKPEFQENFHSTVLSSLLNTLNDSVPRVAGHAAAAITNFVEGLTRESLSNYLKTLLQKCFELLTNGISLVKENAVSAIAATAEAAGEQFAPYFDEAAPLILNLMGVYQAKEYKQLRGQLIECLTLMAHAVGKEKFAPFSQDLIRVMISIQEGRFEKVDPQKSYLLSGWQRLCYVMGNDFAQYLPNILPSLFSLIQTIFSDNPAPAMVAPENPLEGDKDNDYNTYETEEAEVAINLLSVLIEEMKGAFVPYVVTVTNIILPLCDYKTNEGIRKSAAKCLPSIIACLKETSEADAINSSKIFLSKLFEVLKTEHEPEVIQEQIESMKEIFEVLNQTYLTQVELGSFVDHIIKIMMDSDIRRAETEKAKHEEGVDEEEVTMLAEDASREEDIHLAIAELLGMIFKTHKAFCGQLADFICNQILPKALEPNQSVKMNKFGIFLVDDLIEYLGLEMLSSKWEFLSQALLIYSVSKHASIRQAANYGLGQLAIQSGPHFSVISDRVVNSIYESLKVPINTEKPKVYNHAKDNSIAALGKILKSQGQSLSNPQQVYGVWLDNMPLKFDKLESIGQNEFLADLVIANAPIIQETTPKIMFTLGEILDTKTCSDGIRPKVVEAIVKLTSYPNVSASFNEIMEKLSVAQRKRVNDIFANQGRS